jgi:hypothetical protein
MNGRELPAIVRGFPNGRDLPVIVGGIPTMVRGLKRRVFFLSSVRR